MKTAPKRFEGMLIAMGTVSEKPLEYAKKNLLHVQDKHAAIYLSGYEILLMFKAIFGYEKRCLTFYQVMISAAIKIKNYIYYFNLRITHLLWVQKI